MLTRPPQESIDRLEKAVTRSKRSTVRFPQTFARDAGSKVPTPTLATLLRGGGEVRLKVYMTVLMMATVAPHSTKVTAKDLATMLGLRDPEGSGARRVSKAFKDLTDMDLLRREGDPGHVPTTTVLDPAGSGDEWNDLALPKPYITLPIALWRRGWFIALSGRAVALLIILRELTHGRKGTSGAWVDGIRKRQYGFSDDTWTRATEELRDAGLLDITEQVFSSRGEPRRRNVYKLRLNRLESFDPGDELLELEDAT